MKIRVIKLCWNLIREFGITSTITSDSIVEFLTEKEPIPANVAGLKPMMEKMKNIIPPEFIKNSISKQMNDQEFAAPFDFDQTRAVYTVNDELDQYIEELRLSLRKQRIMTDDGKINLPVRSFPQESPVKKEDLLPDPDSELQNIIDDVFKK